MAHFYGWKDEYLNNLPNPVFQNYLKAIRIIESQQALTDITANTYPDMKKQDRNKVWKKFNKDGYSSIEREPQGLASWDKLVGNGN